MTYNKWEDTESRGLPDLLLDRVDIDLGRAKRLSMQTYKPLGHCHDVRKRLVSVLPAIGEDNLLGEHRQPVDSHQEPD